MSAYLSRYFKVRRWRTWTDELSAPFVWDRKRSTLSRYHTDEWAVLDDQLHRAIQGGAFNSRQFPAWVLLGIPVASAPASSTLALDSAYTYNSAGDAVGVRIVLTADKTLSAVYYYISSTNGTDANINDINFELRNDSGSYVKPGSTLHTSSNMDPNGDASVTGWHKQDPADHAMTAGTPYWAIIADADGNGTDFATIVYAATNLSVNHVAALSPQFFPFTATDGFATNPANQNNIPTLVLEFSDGSVFGSSLITNQNPTSDTARRGLYLSDLTEQISIIGMVGRTVSANISGLEVYDSSTVPGGSTLASGTAPAVIVAGTEQGAFLSAPYTLAKETAYRIVFSFSAAAAIPNRLQFGTANGHTTVLRAARKGGGAMYYAWANGTTDWANDNEDEFPQVELLIEDQVAVASSGGSHVIF